MSGYRPDVGTSSCPIGQISKVFHQSPFITSLLSVLNIQIATLMGFTWIFGYIAAFTGVVALWYIYIILNSLQGLFIFISFICNRRVGLLWSAKLGVNLVRPKSKTSSSGTNKTHGSAHAQNRQQSAYSALNHHQATPTGDNHEDEEVKQPLQMINT